MLRRSLGLFSKAKAATSLPFAQAKSLAAISLHNTQNALFSSVWKNIIHQTKSLNTITKYTFTCKCPSIKMS